MVPRRPPRPDCWTSPPGAALASDPHTAGADPAGLAWSVMCCTVWHGSITGAYPYIPYYNRRLCWPVQRPAWRWYLVSVRGVPVRVRAPTCRRRYYICLYRSSIFGCRMVQTAGKAPVKPCALFYGVGGIIAFTEQNALKTLIWGCIAAGQK